MQIDSVTSRRVRLRQAAARQPLALVVVGVLLYSAGPVLAQASPVSGPVFSLWRLWLGVVVFAAVTAVGLRLGGRWPDRRGWRWAWWAGLAFGVHQLLFFSALKATSVTDLMLVSTLSPIATAIGAAWLFSERPGASFRLWTGLAMVGTAVVILDGSAGPEGDPTGMAMAVANVAFFAVFFLLSKRAREDIDVAPFLLGTTAVAAVTVSLFALATGQPVAAVEQRDLLLAAAVAVGPGGLGHFAMTWPLRWLPANVPPVMRLAQPVLAGWLAWWFLGEGVTTAHLMGGLLTGAGVAGAVLSPGGRRFAASERPQEPVGGG